MSVDKALCKYDKKEIKAGLHEFAACVSDPRFICRKCARAAHHKKHLCKPEKISAG